MGIPEIDTAQQIFPLLTSLPSAALDS